ncbi:MAG TPA: glycosyl hydrolase [Gemmatimonadaceae bacterium]
MRRLVPTLLAPLIASLIAGLALAPAARGQQYDPSLFHELRWRMIGPHRGGRTVAAVGVPGHPNVFYIGVNGGGVWKSTDYGRVWTPIFDDQPTGSIGAIAVAPSDPDVIYVGTGEGLQRPDLSTGDGMYRSTDAGKTWTHLGLRDAQQIAAVVVDPRDPNRLFVAALGHPYGPNPERGIFRSTDGGRTFEKVLYEDENTGAVDVAIDPSNPQTVYAVLWAARQAPWEMGSSWTLSGKNGLFKSTDGGTTWRRVGTGLPGAAEGLGRIGIEVARANPRRLYAVVGADKRGGIYRSDDAGESWTLVDDDERLWGRDGDFNEIRADPTNPDVVYIANVVTWKSTDGGKHFTAFRGAPGGDDYHRVWIDPDDPKIILIAADQGAIITVNGGETWSSWYNQPTAQFYHVSTDNAFPYRVCGGQQESGSVCIRSRGPYGEITFREWYPVGVEEYGYVAPDPLDPDIVYGGRVSRFDRRTRQVQNVAPRLGGSDDFRVVRTQPILFSPVDPHVLYFASNVLWKTTDGGTTWEKISPDLTRASAPVPGTLGAFTALDPEHGKHRGVIYTIAPSYRSAKLIWVGTDDGLIHVTHDGGAHWRDVTPSALRDAPWSKVSLMDASHFDTLTAYAAVNTFRLDDLRPHIYRTHDGGRTWTEITNGLPDGAIIDVVREDPERKGLLYAGSETQVWVSFDDGDHWQSLRLDMPATSIRDLVVHENDLVVATHGRSFWILDDVTPLRQLDPAVARADAFLFRPQVAYRVRWNLNTDTPLPQEEPAGENPPDGAIIDYTLRAPASGAVTLEILDDAGKLVRRYSSADAPEPPVEGRNIPDYWIRPPRRLSTAAGMHRFVWDLHYAPPAVLEFGYPIAAVYRNTPRVPLGTWVRPGRYTVRLTVNGHAYTQPLTVKMDPNVKTPPAALARQFALSMRMYDALRRDHDALDQVHALREQLADRKRRASDGALVAGIDAVAAKAAALEGGAAGSGGGEGGGEGAGPSLRALNGRMARLFQALQGADAAPTSAMAAGVSAAERTLDQALRGWRELRANDLASLNARLARAGLETIGP